METECWACTGCTGVHAGNSAMLKPHCARGGDGGGAGPGPSTAASWPALTAGSASATSCEGGGHPVLATASWNLATTRLLFSSLRSVFILMWAIARSAARLRLGAGP